MSLEKTLTKAMTIAPAAVIPIAGAAYAQDTTSSQDDWSDNTREPHTGRQEEPRDLSPEEHEDRSADSYAAGDMHHLGNLDSEFGLFGLGAFGLHDGGDSLTGQGLLRGTYAPTEDLRFNLRAHGGYRSSRNQTSAGEDSTFRQTVFNAGLGFGGYLARGDVDAYLEGGVFYDLLSLGQDIGDMKDIIKLDASEGIQLGGRLGIAHEDFIGAFSIRGSVGGGYEGQIAGIDVNDDFRHLLASLTLEPSLGDFGFRVSGGYEGIAFKDLLETETLRVAGGPVFMFEDAKGLFIHPYVMWRQQHDEFPRTGQHEYDPTWRLGGQVEYHNDSFLAFGDVAYDFADEEVRFLFGIGFTLGYSRED